MANKSDKERYIAENSEYSFDEDLFTFSLVDASTVDRLRRDGDIDLPKRKVNVPKDERWNTKQMASKLMQGILNGDSIPKISESLLDVIHNNDVSATRAARTLVTQAENHGRLDSYKTLDEQGVVQEKVWIATPDSRTRASHLDVDGETVGINDTFSNGLEYPADPSGEPEEVYNCRCSMRTEIVGFRRADGSISRVDYERDETMHEGQMEAEKKERDKENNEKINTKKEILTNKDYENIMKESLANIYEMHRIDNNLNEVSASELGNDFFNVYYGSIDSESAKTFTETITDLAEKYDTSLQEIRLTDKLEYLSKRNVFAFTYHEYSFDKTTLVINPVKFKENEDYINRVKELIDSNYSAKILKEYAEKYVATHEFAHTLIDMQTPLIKSENFVGADYKKIEKARKEIENVYSKYMNILESLEKEKKPFEFDYIMNLNEEAGKKAREITEQINNIKVSKYSMINSDEFMAECFTMKQLNKSVDNVYVNEVSDIIDKYFGRSKK